MEGGERNTKTLSWHNAADSPVTLFTARLFQKDSHLSHCFSTFAIFPNSYLHHVFPPPVFSFFYLTISPSLLLYVACALSAHGSHQAFHFFFLFIFILSLPPTIFFLIFPVLHSPLLSFYVPHLSFCPSFSLS